MELVYEIKDYCEVYQKENLLYIYQYDYDENNEKVYNDFVRKFKIEDYNKMINYCNFNMRIRKGIREVNNI